MSSPCENSRGAETYTAECTSGEVGRASLQGGSSFWSTASMWTWRAHAKHTRSSSGGLRHRHGRGALERYGAFFGFHWPGDHRSKPASIATFPVRIAEAQVAGQQLARLIRRCFRSDQEVFFIAHSLGCRVVMEALYAIAAMEADGVIGLATVRGVFLMAGAVPYQKCKEGQIFRRRDPERPRDWVIHSARDLVLRVPFPSGEWLHGEGGGEAIGRHGLPTGRWHRSVPTKLGHGDYWNTWPGVLKTCLA